MTQITYTLADIEAVAEKVLPLLKHKVVIFKGAMGFGKTTLIKALVKALGSTDNVSIPTFSLVNPYEGADSRIYHFDFYRLKTPEEAFDIGFEEYIGSEGVCIIEWSQIKEDVLPDERLDINIKYEDEGRRLEFIPRGQAYERLVEEVTRG